MLKNYAFLFLILFGTFSSGLFAQTVVINTGITGTAQHNAGPIYRSAASNTHDASRYAYLYTQSELAAVGITNGANITQLGWIKNNVATSLGIGGIIRIYAKNSAASSFSNATETWANLNTGATLVFEDLNYTVPATATPNYITFPLITPFTYFGGSLEISVEWDINQVIGNPTSGPFGWLWSTVPDRIYGIGTTTLAGAGMLSKTTNSVSDITNRRPFIQISYTPGVPCINPPNAGIATTNNVGPVCPYSTIQLNLSGNTTGIGMTYEWESSATLSPFVPTSISAPTPAVGLAINPITTRYYRAKVVCNNGTPVYATPVLVTVAGGLASNTYTINSALPTAGLNYNSFADAITAMNCGILGPVTFNVAPNSGPYVETLTIPTVLGASAINTITFNGNGNTVQFNNTTTERQMLTLNGAKYVKIDSLIFKTLNANFGWGAMIANGSAYDSITNCVFDLTATTSDVSGNTSGICFTSSVTSEIEMGINGTHCYIGNNKLYATTDNEGAYYALTICGASDSNTIENNLFQNFYSYGIYISDATGSKIIRNELHRATKNATNIFYGIRTIGFTPGTLINGNRIHSPGGVVTNSLGTNGMYLSGDGTATQPCIVSNNAIYNITQGGTIRGVFLDAAPYTKVYHNTINIDKILTGTAANYGIFAQGTLPGVEIKNNNISITGGTQGIKFGFYYAAVASIADAQRNNIYVNSTQAGTQHYGYYVIAPYANLSTFQLDFPTLELGSLTANPQFLSAATGNLLPVNPLLANNGNNLLADVTQDINGITRSATPTPGAFELLANMLNNTGATTLVNPVGVFCSGPRPVQATIANFGVNDVTSVQVSWSVNGVLQTSVNYTTLIGHVYSGSNTATINLGVANFPAGTTSTVKVWTSLPNGLADTDNSNDTLTMMVTPSYSVTVDLGNDTSICTGKTLALSASNTGATYQWSNGATSQNTIFNTVGNHYVVVTTADACIGTDSLQLSLYNLPIVDLGNDTSICPGVVLTLNAGNSGAAYLWNDGSTSQINDAATEGTYSVVVTDMNGCAASDGIFVNLIEAPVADGINATYGDAATYTFYPLNPQFSNAYVWNFGDGSPEVSGLFVQHTYTQNGIFTVTCTMEGICNDSLINITRTVDVFDAGTTNVKDKTLANQVQLYPNPALTTVVIESNGSTIITNVRVYNVAGKHIWTSLDTGARMSIDVQKWASGLYIIKIQTTDGLVVKKVDIL